MGLGGLARPTAGRQQVLRRPCIASVHYCWISEVIQPLYGWTAVDASARVQVGTCVRLSTCAGGHVCEAQHVCEAARVQEYIVWCVARAHIHHRYTRVPYLYVL